MDGLDCEMAEESPSISSSLDSGSKIEENLTDWIETEDEFETSGPKTEYTESDVSSSYSDHSFDQVLDDLPWSNTMPPSKLCALCQNMIDDLGSGISYPALTHVRNPLDIKASAQNGCSLCAALIRTDDEKGRDAMISRYIDKWKARFGEAPIPCSRVIIVPYLPPEYLSPYIELNFLNEPRPTLESMIVSRVMRGR
ncbi:hypothetical protein BOTCAL_0492g00020 [Botryotinia calthae]|uniref:Uncharacterized protein n=1 Tax=Botryotinia calthae TaxID=38488 RepID=A0A4Y8CLN6_9HELO|nr:hypothetical protein BOTCAL_0492g00020 [Botryotinia calthae]